MASSPPPPPPPPSERFDFSAGSHAEPEVWLPRLLRLLGDQLELAGQIEVVDANKAAALLEEDMDLYLVLLEERQPLITRLTELNEELKPFAERFALLATSLKDEQREAVYAQAGALDAALSQITERDTAEAALLAERRDGLARDLSNVRTGRAALGAYGEGRQPPPPQSHDEHI
jgi:hypothetical protein